jgi:hypothetical protein
VGLAGAVNRHIALADALETELRGERSLQGVLDDAQLFFGETAACFHGLQHFLADADIRARDPAYADMQNDEMRSLIGLLRQQAPAWQLEKVSFLGQADLSEPARGKR